MALASGCAGALAFTTGVSAALIGVIVAVALLPPLVMLGGGHPWSYEPNSISARMTTSIKRPGQTNSASRSLHHV